MEGPAVVFLKGRGHIFIEEAQEMYAECPFPASLDVSVEEGNAQST